MKMNKIMLFTLLVSVVFVGCGKGEDSVFSFDKTSMQIIVGEEISNALINGLAPYQLESFEKEIVSVTLEGNNVKAKGIKKGNAVIVVSDKDRNKARFAVQVKDNPKTDATIRIEWDDRLETKGGFSFSKKDKKTTFLWQSNDKKNSISLDFDDSDNLIRRGSSVTTDKQVAKSGTLRVVKDGGKSSKYKVSSVVLIKSTTTTDGKQTTLWLKFVADKKEGICVGVM